LQTVLESIGPPTSAVPYAQLIREAEPKPRTGGPKRNQRASFCAKTAQDAWNDARKKSGIRSELRMHDFRRTQATDVWRVTKDLLAVKRLLGHESVSTTAGYIQHESAEPLRELMRNGYSPTRAAADHRAAADAGRILTPLETRRTQ
jgi:integrase